MSLMSSTRTSSPSFSLLPIEIGAFCVLWSFAFIAGKVGVTDCPPLLLLAARFLTAGVLIFAIAALRRQNGPRSWSLRDIGVFALLGIVNNALYLGLGYIGLQSVSAGLGTLIVSANPIFTAILAALFLGEAFTWRKGPGLVLGIAGVGLIVAHRMSGGTDSVQGILFTLASLAAIVAGTILFKLFAPKGDLWIGNGIQSLSAGIMLAPIALMTSSVSDIHPSLRLFGAFAFLVLCGSILAFLLWFHLLAVCGATAASSFHFLIPPLGMFFAWLVLGERIVPFDFLGVLPVVLGIYLVTRTDAGAAKLSALKLSKAPE